MASNDKTYNCLNNDCEKMFKSMSARSNHMKTCAHPRRSPRKKMKVNADGGKVKYKCKHCPQLFSFTSSLYKHRKICNPSRMSEGKEPIPEKPPTQKEFVCSTCYRVFDRAGKRDIHELNSHLGENDKYCNTCGKKFKRIDHYTKHVLICKEKPQKNMSFDELPEKSLEIPSFIDTEHLYHQYGRNSGYDTNENADGGVLEEIGELGAGLEKSDAAAEGEENEDATLDEESVEDFLGCSSFISSGEVNIIQPHDFVRESVEDFLVGSFISSDEINIDHPHDFVPEPVKDVPGCSSFTSSDQINIDHPRVFDPELSSTLSQGLINEDDDSAMFYSSDSDENDDSKKTNYKDKICEAVLSDLKDNRNDSEYIFSRLYSYFGVQITHDLQLQKWLSKSLYGARKRKHRFVERLFKWLKPKIEIPRKRGRHFTPEQRQLIFDTWINNSTISVDRRDGRDVVRIPMTMYNKQYYNIETTLVSFEKNKRNSLMAQAPRYMCHVTTSEIMKTLEDKHDFKVCRGTVHSLKPFFVNNPTDREKLECLCTTCCNIRLLFQAIQRRAKKNNMQEYTSITSYFTSNKNCGTHRNGYISRSCLTGICENCSGIISPHPYSFKEDDVVTYYQFELVPTGKLNKKGKPKKKTQRVDYNSVPTSSVVEKLNGVASKYMLHRYDVSNDKTIWPLIREKCNEEGVYVVHMDFSENLKEKPKFETQPHHFSGQQHSLHCSVAETPDGNIYFYHFSDEETHDWRFTRAVILDLIKKLFKDQEILRFKTDNCTVQYKCLHVFGMYIELAKTIGKKIIICYGAAGHGRCLADGMSSWGVKNPLRKHIITADFWWLHASQLVKMFHDKGFHSKNRDYSELTIDHMQSFPKTKEQKIPGCTKYHMIAFDVDGSIEVKEDICECEMCFTGLFGKCMYGDGNQEEGDSENDSDGNDEDDEDPGDDDDNDDDDEDPRFDMLCETVEPGKIIALRTPKTENESFYLVCVFEIVRDSPVDAYDCFNHYINKGDNYLSCCYLEIESKTKRFVKYRKCTSKVFVLPGEVLSPFVDISEDLVLKMDEKQWLDDMA